MKINGLAIVLILITAGCLVYLPYEGTRVSEQPAYASPQSLPAYGEINMSFIYDYLGQFGFWVEYQPYGYVWVPRITLPYWRPYTNGRWVWTDYGWTWYSYFDWGWLPFHYGRWDWDDQLGWFWVPDVIWAPAWVVWRFSDLYLGWAPLPPGVEFSFEFGLRWTNRHLPRNYWVFVEARRFQENNLINWILPPERNLTIINLTILRDRFTVRNRKLIIDDAIRPEEIERLTRRPVTLVKLKEAKQPTETGIAVNTLRIYRPEVIMNKTSPKTILRKEEVREKMVPVAGEINPENLEQVHKRERNLLEETQKMEIEQLKKKTEEEARVAPPQEKQEKQSELKSKLEELKKKHESEKQNLLKRQSEEKSQIKKGNLKKKSEVQK